MTKRPLSLPFQIPWFIYDLTNNQLITSRILPSDIRDSKSIILAETPIPGLNYQPVQPGGFGNRKISFTLPLIRRDVSNGNVAILKQFDMLRNQAAGFLQLDKTKFNPNPKVLYQWGTGSIPLVYWVSKCDFVHKAELVNSMAQPQYTEVEMELILDETDPLYQAEMVYRQISAIAGEVLQAADATTAAITGQRPY